MALHARCPAAIAAALIAAAAAAQQEAPQDAPDEHILAGPTVQETKPPGTEGSLTDRSPRQGIPMPAFNRILNTLRDEPTPPGLRLTDEQLDRLQELREQFQNERAEYIAQARRELLAARQAFRQEAQDDPDAEANPQDRLRETAARLRREAPQDSQLQARLWATLTPEQRELAQNHLDRLREAMDEQLMERSIERFRRARRAEDAPAEPARPQRPASRPAAAEPRPPGISPELWRRIHRLPEAQRDRLIQRLRDRTRPIPEPASRRPGPA